MVEAILIKSKSAADGWILLLANGIEFEYNNLTVGEPGEQFTNRAGENFLYMGSLNVDNETLGIGVHYLLQAGDESFRMIRKENFEMNFQRI